MIVLIRLICYLALLLFGALDVIITGIVLSNGGEEVNPIARWVLSWGGMVGLGIFKAVALTVAITLLEWSISRRPEMLPWLIVALALNSFPVFWGFAVLFLIITS